MRLHVNSPPQMIFRTGLTPCHTSVLILCPSGDVGIDIVPLPMPCVCANESSRFPNRPPPIIIGGEGNGWGTDALVEGRGEGISREDEGKEGFDLEGACGT